VPGLSHLDLQLLRAVYGGEAGAWGPVMVAFTLVGSGWTALALLPAAIHPRTRRFATALALGILAQATLVWAVKAAVGRVRPWIALGLPPPIGAPHDGSFPSGHAAGSFCVAAFLAVALPATLPGARLRARAGAAGVAVLAAFIASSRVYLGAHFPADVLCGALLGGAIGAAAAAGYLRTAAPEPNGEGADGPVERAAERG
jgi:undecaprenyl-diphosphatase